MHTYIHTCNDTQKIHTTVHLNIHTYLPSDFGLSSRQFIFLIIKYYGQHKLLDHRSRANIK